MLTVRRTYHTNIKMAAFTGILPDDIARLIPRSTLSQMRRQDPSYHFGAEYAALIEQMELLKEIARSRTALKTASAVLRIAHLVRSLQIPVQGIKHIKAPELRAKIVTAVERAKAVLPLAHILKFFGLTHSRIRAWSRNTFSCIGSPRALCRRVYPNQLTRAEVNTIRTAFTAREVQHWPAVSVAWDLVNRGKISANVQTITRYAMMLGLTASRGIPHKCRKRGSISCSRPNEVWHLDATVVHTLDNRKGYVQLLMDNFSRKIIAYRTSDSVSGLSTAAVLQKGYDSLQCTPVQKIDLIVDGGPENKNSAVKMLLESIPLKKLIAGVDVTYSNSLIEAVNKILKYRYLFRGPIPDLEHLATAVMKAIEDYNNRPHLALWGLTPNQGHAGTVFDKEAYRERITIAGIERRRINHRACPPCVAM